MIIVSLQEIVELDLDHILYDSNNILRKVGARVILNTMNGARTGKGSEDIDEYSILISRVALVGTYMLVAVKKKHIDFVEKIEFEDISCTIWRGCALGEQSRIYCFSIYQSFRSRASI